MINHNTTISIIIPNLHSLTVNRTIRSVLAQETIQPFEIIVVGMDKYNLIQEFSDQVSFIRTKVPTLPGISRNIGVENANGDFFFFIDSDCIANPKWIENHLLIHKNEDISVIVGGGITFPAKNYLTLADNVSSFHEFMSHLPFGEREYLPTLNLSLSRQAWETIGNFRGYPASEDIEFTMRASQKNIPLIFEPEATVEHLPNRKTFPDLFHHAYSHGRFSLKGNPAYRFKKDVPFITKNKALTIIFSPILSAYVILKILVCEKLPTRYWHTLPLIFLLKIAWCFGLADQPKSR